MVGWTRRNRERDAEMRRAWRRFDAWWATATEEEKAAWKKRQAEQSRYDWLWGLTILVPFLPMLGIIAMADCHQRHRPLAPPAPSASMPGPPPGPP